MVMFLWRSCQRVDYVKARTLFYNRCNGPTWNPCHAIVTNKAHGTGKFKFVREAHLLPRQHLTHIKTNKKHADSLEG